MTRPPNSRYRTQAARLDAIRARSYYNQSWHDPNIDIYDWSEIDGAESGGSLPSFDRIRGDMLGQLIYLPEGESNDSSVVVYINGNDRLLYN
jgi:hypothetical protein